MHAKSLQSCLTLCDPMDCSLPVSSVCDDSPSKTTELPCPPPGDLPDPGIKPASLMSPSLAGGFFTTSAPWEAPRATLSPANFQLCPPAPWTPSADQLVLLPAFGPKGKGPVPFCQALPAPLLHLSTLLFHPSIPHRCLAQHSSN